MKVHFHKHHPLNATFGYKRTHPMGAVKHKYVVWLFCGLFDIVFWI